MTSGDVADVHIVMAYALDGGARRPTLFLVPADTPGITVVEDPDFTHNYPHGHPTLAFDVEVGPDAVLGGVGAGDELQRAWFTEERLGIAARGIGAMTRLLEETLAWATGREQGGARLWDHQGVAFPLADSAADAAAGRLLCLEVARLADEGADPKVVHAKAVDGQAVRERGGRALRRPRRAGLRGPRLPARQRGRAAVAGAAGGPHLGGDERDPAPHRRALAGAARGGARGAVGRPPRPQTYATPVSGAGAPGGTKPGGSAAFFPAGDARIGLHFALLSSMNAKRAGERAFSSCGA